MTDSIPTPPEQKPVEPKAEPPVEKTPTYSYDEVHKEPIKEIAENKELPKEKPPEPTEEEKAKEAEAKAKADAEAKAKAEAEAKEKEEEAVAPEALAEDISKKIAEKLAPKEKIEKDKYTEFFEKAKKEKGRDPNWIELSQFLEEQAVARVEKKQEEAKKVADKQKEEQDKANEEYTKRFNAQVNEELEELYKSGQLTEIKDKNSPSDQGVIERKALFQAMLDTNAKRTVEGKDQILSISRIFHNYYTKPSAQPAGENAPISMGKGTPAGEGEQELDYIKDIKKPWSFFKQTRR